MFKILTEASKEIGFGHFSRISSICNSLLKDNIEFILYLDADEVAKKILREDYIVYEKWTNVTRIKELVKKDDIVLIDSYSYSVEFLTTVKLLARKVIVIDDNVRLDYRDVTLINPNYFGEYLQYPQNNGNCYYIGKECTLLRPEFVNHEDRHINEDVKRILITMGGSDVLDLTHTIIDKVLSIDSTVSINVVATEAYSNLEEIKKRIREQDRLVIGASAKQMAKLMKIVDFAISSAGGTTNELIKMQCPSIVVPVADNQELNAMYLQKNGLVECFKVNAMDEIRKMFKHCVRKTLCENMKQKKANSNAVDILMKLIVQ